MFDTIKKWCGIQPPAQPASPFEGMKFIEQTVEVKPLDERSLDRIMAKHRGTPVAPRNGEQSGTELDFTMGNRGHRLYRFPTAADKEAAATAFENADVFYNNLQMYGMAAERALKKVLKRYG